MFDEFKNAFQRYNNGHVQLIIINVVVFLALGVLFVVAKFSQSPSLFNSVYLQLALPSDLNDLLHKPWTILTYSFTHLFHYSLGAPDRDQIGIFHILFNMLGFYWFAKVFIEYLGSDKLISLYVLGGLAGGLLFLLLYNTIPYFEGNISILVGASAAVFAVMTAVAVLLPDYTFFLMFIGPVKVKYIAAFYILISFLFSAGDNAGGNIAHLGGALMGFVYIKQLQAGVNWGSWITVTLDWFKNLFKPKPKVKVTYRSEDRLKKTKSSSSKPQVSQEELDAILDKISVGGYESLSKEEKEKLFNASKK
ncbi:MAG TPA: rhomboid family intramembrane serine protease [Ohtaekwangia sp.]